MNRIIQGFIHGDTSVVKLVTSSFAAKEMFDVIKEKDFMCAVDFMEQYHYFAITGNLMR